MQMLQSLLAAAGRQSHSSEARAILHEASSRVAAMAAAQRVLYDTPDATRFNAAQFLNAVCQTAAQAFSANIQVECDLDDVVLSNDMAMPLALIINELVTNAMKHGLHHRESNPIRVGLVRDAAGLELFVGDDGPGFDLEAVRQNSSGLRLVEGLARQLRAKFEVTGKPTRCTVTFAPEGTG